MIRQIKCYEGLYEIDENGNVFSIPRNGTCKIKRKISSRVNKYGYKQVSLNKNNKQKTFLVHRLVGFAFLENTLNLPQINHKDGNKLNNHYSNLEFCTKGFNTKHAFENNLKGFKERALENLNKINSKNSYKSVELYIGNEKIAFNTTAEAAAFLNTCPDNITRAYRKGQKCKGYKVSLFR